MFRSNIVKVGNNPLCYDDSFSKWFIQLREVTIFPILNMFDLLKRPLENTAFSSLVKKKLASMKEQSVLVRFFFGLDLDGKSPNSLILGSVN
jgi:hypothetical protein